MFLIKGNRVPIMSNFQLDLTYREKLIELNIAVTGNIVCGFKGTIDVPFDQDLRDMFREFLNGEIQLLNFKDSKNPAIATRFYVREDIMFYGRQHGYECFELQLTVSQKDRVRSIFGEVVRLIGENTR